MDTKNRILVLVDFSAQPENLIDFAFQFSEKINAKIVLVHKVAGMAPAMTDESLRKEIIENEYQEARLKLQDLAKDRIYADDSFVIDSGPLLSILKNLQSPRYFDWVFSGIKKSGALKRVFLGSSILPIIENSDFLSLSVPVIQFLQLPKRFLMAVSPQFPINESQLEQVLNSMKPDLEEILFFTITGEQESGAKEFEYLKELETKFQTFKPDIKIYKSQNLISFFNENPQLLDDAYLVLQQGSRNLTDKVFRKFMVNEMIFQAQTPLIVLSE